MRKDNGKFIEQLNPQGTDTSESASILLTYPTGFQSLFKYAGTGDQCVLIQVSADKASKLDLTEASALLARQHYDPLYVPTQDDALLYTTIEGNKLLAKQNPPTKIPKMLVTWHGPGGIPLPDNPEWKLDLLTAYNNAARPVAEFHNDVGTVDELAGEDQG